MNSVSFNKLLRLLTKYFNYTLDPRIHQGLEAQTSLKDATSFLADHDIDVTTDHHPQTSLSDYLNTSPITTGIVSLKDQPKCLLFINGDFISGTEDDNDIDSKGFSITRINSVKGEKTMPYNKALCGDCVAKAFNQILVDRGCHQLDDDDRFLITDFVETGFQDTAPLRHLQAKRPDLTLKLKRYTSYATLNSFMDVHPFFTGLVFFTAAADSFNEPFAYVFSRGHSQYSVDYGFDKSVSVDNSKDGLVALKFISCVK